MEIYFCVRMRPFDLFCRFSIFAILFRSVRVTQRDASQRKSARAARGVSLFGNKHRALPRSVESSSGLAHNRAAGASEKDVEMGAALASFVRLSAVLVGEDRVPDDLAAVYFDQARRELGNELPALLERFDELLHEGTDPRAAVGEHLVPDSRWGPPA